MSTFFTRLQQQVNNSRRNINNSSIDPLLRSSLNPPENNSNNNSMDNDKDSLLDFADDDDDLKDISIDGDDDDMDSYSENQDDDVEAPSLTKKGQLYQLRIKSTRDFEVSARASDTVATLKRIVLRALSQTTTTSTTSSSISTSTTAGDQHQHNHHPRQAKIQNQPPQPQPYVRLICAGRMLTPDTAPISDYLQDGSVVHAVISKNMGAQAVLAGGLSSTATTNYSSAFRALRGTGVDARGFAVRRTNEMEDSTEDDDDDDDDEDNSSLDQQLQQHQTTRSRTTNRRQRLGFDRLRDTVGFRRSEVSSIRAYFNRSIDRWIRENPVLAEQAASGESDFMRRRLLQEDAWMQSQGPTSEFRLNVSGGNGLLLAYHPLGGAAGAQPMELAWRLQQQQQQQQQQSVGTDRDFLWGFLLGFFVGFLMLLWVWMPTVPHKQKLGILTGISVQLALNMLQSANHDESSSLLVGEDNLVLSEY